MVGWHLASMITPQPAAESVEPSEDNGSRAVSWNALLSTYLPAMVLALGTGIALPAIPVLAKSFDVSFGLASWVLTSFLIGGLAGSLPTGWLLDRVGRRPVMIAGPLLTAGIALLVMTAQSFPQLLIYRFADGWAAQMWLLARLARISLKAAPGQRGRQVSWMYGMDNLGRLSGPLVGGFIATAWGPRAPFGAYALLALLAVLPSLTLSKEVDSGPAPKNLAPENATRPSVWEVVVPRLPFFGIAFFSAMARAPVFADMLHLYAAFAYNLNARTIGILATAASATSLPIGFAAGWMMDRFGRKKTMVPGFFGVTLAMSLLAVTALLHLPLEWYVVVFLCTVAAQSLTGGSIQTVGADVAPPNARGMFLGMWRFTSQIGTSLSPLIFAFLADASGYASSFVFVAASAGVVAILLVTLIPETGNRVSPV